MKNLQIFKIFPVALMVAAAVAPEAKATTQSVTLNVLNATVTLPTPFLGGDSLVLDTLVTSQTGSLLQTINFSVGNGVASVGGDAAWQISTAAGLGPRLIGVNLDLFSNTTNALVVSDGSATVVGGFAISSFASTVLTPGSYRLVATGTGIRDSVLDVTLSFTSAVPEAGTTLLMFGGLAFIGAMTVRRRPSAS